MRTKREGRNRSLISVLENCILVACVLLALFTRLYRLAEIPFGMHVDEAGMAYDAWSLVHYGVDRWLNEYPVYLLNYGEGQSALYAYLCAFLIKIVGHGEVTCFIVRLPGAIISFLAYLAGVYMIWKAFQKRWAVVGAFILAILPYFIMQCRFGLDCNLLVNMLTISTALLFVAVEKDRYRYYIAAGILWGVTYYTYVMSYIPNTVILICICSYLLWRKRESWKKLLVFLVPIILLGLPLLLMIIINQFELPQIKLAFFTIPRLTVYRSGQIRFQWELMIENVSEVLKSILWRDWLEYNAFSGFYTMYTISIPFVVIGFFSLYRQVPELIKLKRFHPSLVWWFVFVIYFLFGLGIDGLGVNRMNGIFFAQFFLVLEGIRAMFFTLKRWKGVIANGMLAVVLLVYTINGARFLTYYFEQYASEIYPQFLFCGTYEAILEKLEQEGKLERNSVYIEDNYIYYFLSSQIDPYEFNRPGHEEDYFNQFTFYLPEEYEEDAVYIVRETNTEYIEQLKQHTTERARDGMYVCFY